MTIKLASANHPALHRPAAVMSPQSLRRPHVRETIKIMHEIMRNPENPGIGLAAPQLGKGISLIAISDPAELQQHLTPVQLAMRGRRPIEGYVLANPEYDVLDSEQACFFEGCLTYPGRMRAVLRPLHLSVRAVLILPKGESTAVEFEANDWHARILAHEVDHVNGITLDTLDPRICGPWVTVDEFRERGYINLSSDAIRKIFKI